MINLKKNKFILIIFFICLIIVLLMRIVFLKQIYKKSYSEYVSKYAQEYNVEEILVYSIIKAESNFNEKAVSNKGAKGLMQLMEDTANETLKKIDLKIEAEEIEDRLFDAETNINLGTKYISILLEKYGNKEIAITAYNAGTGTVDNWIEKGIINADGTNIEKIPYKETNNYVRKILNNYKIYKKLY